MEKSNRRIRLSWDKSKIKSNLISLPPILTIALLPAVLMLGVFFATFLPIIWERLRGGQSANLAQQALVKHLRAQGLPVEAQVFRGIPSALEENASRIRKRERRAAITINFCWEDETLLYTFLQNPPKQLVKDNEEKRILLRCAACTDSSCYFMVADPRDDYSILWWNWSLPVSCLCELAEK